MKRFKKSQLALLSIFLSTTVAHQAYAIAPDQRVAQHKGWYVELEPFYARATDTLLSTLPFAVTSVDESIIDPAGPDLFTNNEISHTFNSDRDWAYRVAVGYDFPSCNCCTYGFSLEYTYNKVDDNQHLEGFIDSAGFPAVFPYSNNFFSLTTDADASIKYKYHAVDLLGHKNLRVCGCVDMQFFIGARFVHLNENLHKHFFTSDDLIDEVFEAGAADFKSFSDYNSKFNGVGPRVGFNSFYQVVNGFGLVTELSGNLLFGESESKYTERSTVLDDFGNFGLFTDVFEGKYHMNNNETAHVVPGLSGKVGIAYRAVFCNCSSMSVELGYRGDKYFGIGYHSALIGPNAYNASFIKDGSFHDYDISGPYLNVAFHA